jgi:hypothetical protein
MCSATPLMARICWELILKLAGCCLICTLRSFLLLLLLVVVVVVCLLL